MRVERVLLVCTGNTCRSPMAEALLRHLWNEANPGWTLTVQSAGTWALPGMGASRNAVEAMRRKGLDLSQHKAQPAAPELLAQADLVLTMTAHHKEQVLAAAPSTQGRVFTLAEFAGSGADVPDPFGGSLADYERTAETLEQLLKRVVERIAKEGKSEDESGHRV